MSDLTWRRWSPRDRYSSHTENMDSPEGAEVKIRKRKGKQSFLLKYIPQMRIFWSVDPLWAATPKTAEARVCPKSSITALGTKTPLQELMPEATRHLHSGVVVAVSPGMG